MTARELSARKAAPPVAAVAVPAPPPEAAPAAGGARVRMHHPDSTDQHPISCEFTLDGEGVKLEYGVAVVGPALAARLEGMGWRRGREVPQGDEA